MATCGATHRRPDTRCRPLGGRARACRGSRPPPGSSTYPYVRQARAVSCNATDTNGKRWEGATHHFMVTRSPQCQSVDFVELLMCGLMTSWTVFMGTA
jgi:hypothetical protein